MENKVSIITPVYNSARFIHDTYESLKNQEYQNWEWICVDDCSSDESKDILTKLASKDNRIKLNFLKQNKGPAIARNTAIEMATGRFIAFLDSDDMWEPKKLELQLSKMIKENLPMSHTSYGFIDTMGKTAAPPYLIKRKEVSYNDLLKYCEIGCSTVVYDQSILGKVYMANLLKRQDYSLWLKILGQGYQSRGLSDVLTQYRIVKGSVSKNKFKVIRYQWNVLRVIEKQPFIKSIYYIFCWAKHGISKYYMNYR